MKRMILILIISILSILVLVSCDTSTNVMKQTQSATLNNVTTSTKPIHIHTEVIDASIEATCTSTGLSEGKHCSQCGLVIVKQEVVEMLPHTEAIKPAIVATCNAEGMTEGKYCSVCNTVLVEQQTVEMLPHTEIITPAVPATCTQTGLTEGKKCGNCGEVIIVQKTVEKIPHVEVIEPAIPATCTQTGLTAWKHCANCGKVFEAQTIISMIPHTEIVDTRIEATCISTGMTEGKHCSECDLIIVEQKIIPITEEHTYDHNYDRDCNVCGFVRNVTLITSFETEFSSENGYRPLEITESDGVYDYIDTGFDIQALLNDGYSQVSITVNFDCSRISNASLSYIELWIYNDVSSDSEYLFYSGTLDFPTSKSWETKELTFVIDLAGMLNGNLVIEWGAQGVGLDNWTLGYTTVSVIAIK